MAWWNESILDYAYIIDINETCILRQKMKLFTEKELRDFIDRNGCIVESDLDEKQLIPIELPTDEEIKTESKFKSNYSNPQAVQFNPALNIVWIEGANWMRYKIHGGKK
jgi:hypothetical protein